MAGDWRTTKTKGKRELSTLHETTPQRTSYIPQPKCTEGNEAEMWCTASRNISDKRPAVQPLMQGMTVPRQQSWSVSACVIWGGWRGLGRNPLLQWNAVPVLLLLFHVMLRPGALTERELAELEGVRRRQVSSLKPRQGKPSPVLPAGDLHHAPPH